MERSVLITCLLLSADLCAQLGSEQRFAHPVQTWSAAISDVDADGDGDAMQVQGDHIFVHVQVAPNEYRIGYDLGAPGRCDRLVMADLDGDGNDDLLMPRRYGGAIAWVKVLGGGSFDPLQDLVSGIYRPFDVQAHDMDGDADLDLIIAYDTASVKVAWCANLGGGFSAPVLVATLMVYFPTSPDEVSYFDVGDIDNDGDADVLINGSTDYWAENDGAGNFTTVAITNGTFGDVQLAMLNSDAFPDLLFLYDQDVFSRMNDGSGGFNAAQDNNLLFGNATDYASRLHAVDVNADGLDDLVFRHGGYINWTHYVEVAMNDGTGDLDGNSSDLLSNTQQPFAVGDLDGSGLLDLFGPANHNVFAVVNGANHIRISSVAQPINVEVADMDADGDNDVVVSGPTSWGPSVEGEKPLQMGIHTNDGSGNMAQTPVDVWVRSEGIVRSDAVDLDGDADNDLVAVWQSIYVTDKQFMVITNQGGVFDSTGAISPLFSPWFGYPEYIPSLRDLDGDQDIDLVRYRANELLRYANDGLGVFGPEQTFIPFGWNLTSATLCDLDNDGLPDYVWGLTGSGTGLDSIYWNPNTGLGAPGPFQLLGPSPILTYVQDLIHSPVLDALDLNADGLEDLVVFNGDSLGTMLNSGGGLTATQAWPCNARAYAMGDMDLNGYADIVTINSSSDIVAYLNSAVGFGPGQLMASAPQSTGTDHIALGDMDGDLDLDVVTCSAIGYAAWLPNTGTFPLGVPAPLHVENVLIFPVPSDGAFTVRASGPIISVDLIDVGGRVLGTIRGGSAREVRMEHGGLSPGLYVARVVLGNGTVAAARVVVK